MAKIFYRDEFCDTTFHPPHIIAFIKFNFEPFLLFYDFGVPIDLY